MNTALQQILTAPLRCLWVLFKAGNGALAGALGSRSECCSQLAERKVCPEAIHPTYTVQEAIHPIYTEKEAIHPTYTLHCLHRTLPVIQNTLHSPDLTHTSGAGLQAHTQTTLLKERIRLGAAIHDSVLL